MNIIPCTAYHGRRSLSRTRRLRHDLSLGFWIVGAALPWAILLCPTPSSASIRLNGTEFQATSSVVRDTSPPTKSMAANRPTALYFTLGQAVVARGELPGAKSEGSSSSSGVTPHKIGLGYEYSLLYHSFCRCPCHADPVCDSATDVLDVVGTVAVAFRGVPAVVDNDCVHAGRTDVNCSGDTDVIDVVAVVDVAFRNGNPAVRFCRPCVGVN